MEFLSSSKNIDFFIFYEKKIDINHTGTVRYGTSVMRTFVQICIFFQLLR